MSGFNDREKDFENKYAHDTELAFKIEARGCKLFGLWLAEQMGLAGEEAGKYALEVVSSNLEEPGFDDVMKKVTGDLKARNIDLSEHMLKTQLDKALEEGRRQVMTETK